MAIVIARTMIVPVGLMACALVVVLAPSAAVTIGLLLLGGLALTAILLGTPTVHPVVADGLAPIDVRLRSVTAVERADVRPHSWPNSGFRNIGRGTKGG
jgi:hypothetical protein